MEQTQKKEMDLGTGSIGKLMLRLSVPAIVAQLINALYNIVDRIYIGQGVGDTALTGLGVAFPIIMLISAFASLIGMGGAPLASIKMGEQNKEGAEKILGNCTTMLFGVAVVLTAVFLIFGRPMLMLFGATPNTIDYAADYLNIYVAGTIFVQFALGLNAFITAQGFAKTGMITVAIGAVINIVLDPVFIFLFDMGVKGAALATVISQAVSAVWVVRFLVGKRTVLKIRRSCLRLSWKIMLPILALGLSPFIMQSTESILNITFNASLKHYGGELAVGAMTICSTVMQLLNMPLMGLTQGASPIISYNFGARKFDRVKRAFKLLLISCVTVSTVIWVFLMVFPNIFVMLFNNKPQLVDITVWGLRIYTAALFIMGVQIGCQQTFVALGQAKISMFLALLRKVVLLIPLILILPLFFSDKVFAVFLAEPVADVLAAGTTATVFILQFKKILARAQAELPDSSVPVPARTQPEQS